MRGGVRFAAALAALAFCTAPLAQSEAENDRAPVPLYKPAPRSPEETTGTGVAPAVSVRVRVDERGKVAEVLVDRIEPSTDFDDLFRKTTIETLSSWRYAPAVENGEPVEQWLQWTVQYLSREEDQLKNPPSRPTHLLLSEGDKKIDRRWEIVAMAPRAKLALQERTANVAVSLMDPNRRRRAETDFFIVFTDAPVDGVAEKLAGNLEAAYAVVNALWADTVAPQPAPGKVVAFMYASEAQFQRLVRATSGYEWSGGFYASEGVIAFHMEMPTNEHLREAMLHESVHSFLDRHVVRPGARLPLWLDEGLADYVGNSEVRKRKLIPGKYRRHQIYRGPGGMVMGKSTTHLKAADVREAIRRGDAVLLADLVAAERGEFYGEQRMMFYTESWMLVHFLRHGREEWAGDHFPRYVLYVAEGYPPLEAMEHVYGVHPADLEEEFRAYVKRF